MTDRGYLNLLSHLSRAQTTLPLKTIQASIAHYLAHIQPSPTPLAATVVSSPFFLKSQTYEKLDGLVTAFRHAVHIKMKLVKEEPGGLFTRGTKTRMGEWSGEVLKGLQGGLSLLRLACYTGVLQGLDDWEEELKAKESRMRRNVEEELVVALAEVMDLFDEPPSAEWEKEFSLESQAGRDDDMLQLTFLITSRALPMVALSRLRVLPLASLTRLLLSVLDDAFQSGMFLRAFTAGLPSGSALHTNPGTSNMLSLSKSLLLTSMASLSGMCSQLLSVLADHRPAEAWPVMQDTMDTFTKITRNVESDWLQTPFANSDDDEFAPEARDVATATWLVLKTLLFTSIRITQSVLTTVIYVPQPLTTRRTAPSLSTPFAFALTALHTLSRLSFVLPQFGGVSSTSGDGGFPELKRAFYTALDVLSADQLESARFVHELRESMLAAEDQINTQVWPSRFYQAKKAYALACAEQLVKVLSEDSVREDVYPLCAPHLNDPTSRETFESAHSVLLAIFAAHAQRSSEGLAVSESGGKRLAFAESIVPFYTRCLIENSHPAKLNRTQLRLAFRALVRSASTMKDGDAFAWFCVEEMLRASQSASDAEHRQSICYAIVASVSAVSLRLLPRLLDVVLREVIEPFAHGSADVQGLVDALFEEISERVGDTEKEYAMRWWDENKARLGGSVGADCEGDDGTEGKGKGKGKGRAVETMSRL